MYKHLDKIILTAIIIFFIIGIFGKNEKITLAPKSQYSIMMYSKIDSQKPPKQEYRLQEFQNYPESSIYKPTDDFKLITKGLKNPTIFSEFNPNIKTKAWTQKDYTETGKLESMWNIDASELFLNLDTSFPNLPFSVDGDIWALPKTNVTRIYINSIDGTKVQDQHKFRLYNNIDHETILLEDGSYIKIKNKDSGKNHNDIRLYDSKNRVVWSHRFRTFFDKDPYSNPVSYIGTYSNSILIFHKGYIHSVDLSSGLPKWTLKCLEKEYILSWNFVDNFLFFKISSSRSVDKKHKDSKCYRLNVENMEIVLLEIGVKYHYVDFYFRNGNFCDYEKYSKINKMDIYDLTTGVIIDSLTLPDGREWGNFHNNNPFLLENHTDNGLTFSFFDPKTKITEKIKPFTSSNYQDDLYSTSYKIHESLENLFNEDETHFWGYDMNTHKKSWFIEKDQLSENAKVVLIDTNGVLVYDNEKLICFRKPKN